MIAQAIVLLKAAIMFFIDEDHRELCEWQEQGRARAYDDAGAASGHFSPRPSLLRRANIGMPLCRGCTKALFKAGHNGLGQSDLWQQDQHLLIRSGNQGLRDRFKINLCLARPCHPIEQKRAEPACGSCLGNHISGIGLHFGKGACGQGRVWRTKGEVDRPLNLFQRPKL